MPTPPFLVPTPPFLVPTPPFLVPTPPFYKMLISPYFRGLQSVFDLILPHFFRMPLARERFFFEFEKKFFPENFCVWDLGGVVLDSCQNPF